jgi:hypothetical protein
MNLKGAIESQTQNRVAQQRLATGERQIALAEDKQAFDEGQLPWATAAGALGAGVQLYGGYQALEDANAVKARLDKRDAIEQETLRQMTAATKATTDVTGQIARAYKSSVPHGRWEPAHTTWSPAPQTLPPTLLRPRY